MNEKDRLILKEAIDKATNIVFFGGAGVSTESGIPDFRSETGLKNVYDQYGVGFEEILSHHFYVDHPERFYDFYFKNMVKKDAKPNAAHYFLADLEKRKNLTIVTQNIDGLHQKAGSKNVLELHGSIYRNHCPRCHSFYPLEELAILGNPPRCPKCGQIVKPDVVLYEEGLDEWTIEMSIEAIEKADLLIIAGTSLNVYPANQFIRYFSGNNIVVINKSHLSLNQPVLLEINDAVGKVLSSLED